MNSQERFMYKVVDVVVECCSVKNAKGERSITREQILGKSRLENVVMARCVVAQLLINLGYSIASIALFLNRTVHGIRHMILVSDQYMQTSRAYKLAMIETTNICKNLEH